MWGVSATQIFAACDGGRIFEYDGTSWTSMPSPTTQNLGHTWGTSGADVYVAGWGGTLLHYNGSAWTEIATGTDAIINVAWGTADDDIYVLGEHGLQNTILHYDGATFTASASGTSNDLYDVWGTSSGDLYVGGANSTFLRGVRISPATPSGSNVTVAPTQGVVLTFETVTAAGQTSVSVSGTGPTPPSGFILGSPAAYYDLASTAAFQGDVTVCIDYSDIQFDTSPVSLFHFENNVWVDRTNSLDESNHVICAQVSSFSPFLIAEPVPSVIFLRGIGGAANPSVLTLSAAVPTATTAKHKDSPSIKFGGGNLWTTVGTWTATPGLVNGSLTALGGARVWLGLKNSDDIGTRFDVRVEAYRNGALLASGQALCILGITQNPSNAKQVAVSFTPFSTVAFNGTSDVLSLKVLTRIGTTPGGAFCGGHSNAVGVRVYFDAGSRAANISATF
jgi:hypothetical protein